MHLRRFFVRLNDDEAGVTVDGHLKPFAGLLTDHVGEVLLDLHIRRAPTPGDRRTRICRDGRCKDYRISVGRDGDVPRAFEVDVRASASDAPGSVTIEEISYETSGSNARPSSQLTVIESSASSSSS